MIFGGGGMTEASRRVARLQEEEWENRGERNIAEPLAILSSFEIINRLVRAERPAAMEVAVLMFAESP